jgi:hypothetical protein
VGWPEFLDDVEERLVDADRMLLTGGPAVSAFVMPDDLGPMPPDLEDRAAKALRSTIARQVAVEAARDRVADALRQGRVETREPASYLDTRL